MRNIHSLNDGWRFYPSASLETLTTAEYESVTLPHTWSSNEDARRGKRWYSRDLPCPSTKDGERVWLQCNGAAMTAEVYLNGEKLTHHEGGYSAFRVDLTDHLAADNVLAISVDNSVNQTVYPQSADFTFYGGLYRGMELITVPATHFALSFCGTPGIKVTPVVDLAANTASVTVETWVEGDAPDAQTVTFTVANQTQLVQVEAGYAKAVFTLELAL